MNANLGPTLQLALLIFAVLLLTLAVLVVIRKRTACSEKFNRCINWLSLKIFFNPVIRMTMLNALKLNMASLVVFWTGAAGALELFMATIQIACVNIALFAFFLTIRSKHRHLME